MEKWKQEAEALKIVEVKVGSGSSKVADAGSGSETGYLEAEARNSSCFRITGKNFMCLFLIRFAYFIHLFILFSLSPHYSATARKRKIIAKHVVTCLVFE